MNKEYILELLDYINSFWKTDDLVIKGSITHFINDKIVRQPKDLDLAFLAPRNNNLVEEKWRTFISFFEVTSIDTDLEIIKIYNVIWKNHKLRIELLLADNIDKSFVYKYKGNINFYKYEYGILSKIQSLAYFFSSEYKKEISRIYAAIDDINYSAQNLLETPDLESYIQKYINKVLNNNVWVDYYFYDFYLDCILLDKKAFLSKIKDFRNLNEAATKLINLFLDAYQEKSFVWRMNFGDQWLRNKQYLSSKKNFNENYFRNSTKSIAFVSEKIDDNNDYDKEIKIDGNLIDIKNNKQQFLINTFAFVEKVNNHKDNLFFIKKDEIEKMENKFKNIVNIEFINSSIFDQTHIVIFAPNENDFKITKIKDLCKKYNIPVILKEDSSRLQFKNALTIAISLGYYENDNKLTIENSFLITELLSLISQTNDIFS